MEIFLKFWQSWPVFVTALVTLGVTVYAFLPSQKSATAAMIYQVVTVMAFMLALPAILVNPLLNIELFQIADPSVQVAILWLNLLGGLVALLSFLLSILGIGRAAPLPAAQQFANVRLSGQVDLPTPQSVKLDSQTHLSSVRFTTPTSHSPVDFTPQTPPEAVRSPVSTLDDSASQNFTEATELATDAPPARAITSATDDDLGEETIILNPSQAAKSRFFAWLVELNGAGKGKTHALTRHRNVIGRAKGAHILLQDKSVSGQGQHAALLRDDERQLFMLHDLDSANGTYLHGQRISKTPQPLKDKDRIRVGQTELYFMQIRLDELLPEEGSKNAAHSASPLPPRPATGAAPDTAVLREVKK